MGTCNFGSKKLASSLWTFAMDNGICSDKDTSEYEYPDTIENVSSELSDMVDGIHIQNEYQKIYTRDSHTFAEFTIPFCDRESKCWEENKYYLIIENGYYQGARFDIIEDDSEYFEEDAKKTKAYNKKLDKKIEEIEKVFAIYCTPLVKIAQFSNGEYWRYIDKIIKLSFDKINTF